MTCKGARSGPFACQRRHALLACFYSATLAWNYSAVDMPVMTSLYLNGEWAACHFGLRSADVLHYWFPVYNPAYANLSPGLVLLRKVINEGYRQGIKEVDLGEGDAAYKLWLGTDRYENLSADWASPGLRSFAFRAYRSLFWRIQSLCNPK